MLQTDGLLFLLRFINTRMIVKPKQRDPENGRFHLLLDLAYQSRCKASFALADAEETARAGSSYYSSNSCFCVRGFTLLLRFRRINGPLGLRTSFRAGPSWSTRRYGGATHFLCHTKPTSRPSGPPPRPAVQALLFISLK